MEATVSGIEKVKLYIGNDKYKEYIVVKLTPDENTGYALLPYPTAMASLFPLGKRVEITVSEAKDQHELLRRIEQQREYEQGV